MAPGAHILHTSGRSCSDLKEKVLWIQWNSVTKRAHIDFWPNFGYIWCKNGPENMVSRAYTLHTPASTPDIPGPIENHL